MTTSEKHTQHDATMVRMTALTYGGSLIGDVVAGSQERIGKKAFVPFVAPNELVEINVIKEEKRILFGEILKVEERSPQRIEPACPYFMACGGCDLQHLGIESQRSLKRDMVATTLLRQGGVTPTKGVILSTANLPATEYRRKVTLHIDTAGAIGFYRAGSGSVVQIERCLIASPLLNEALTKIIGLIDAIKEPFSAVTLEENDNEEIIALFVPRSGSVKNSVALNQLKKFMKVATRGQLSGNSESELMEAGHFSQVNREGNIELVRLVLAKTPEGAVTELYAGAGNFSIPLATRGTVVTAVEVDPVLTAAGTKAAHALGISERLTFLTSSTEAFLKKQKLGPTVLLDPPRSGAKDFAESVDAAETHSITYVSCNLPSLTRDLKILTQKGYELIETVVVDMFPQTHHVETVSLLVAK